MVGNYFGRFLDVVAKLLRKFPAVSTWFAAVFLSTIWTGVWLFVFFASTWLFDLTTKATDLITVFWLSVAAEAVIRWAENTNFIAALSKPHIVNPTGDNEDFRVLRAFALFLLSLCGMFFFDFYMEKIGLKDAHLVFTGQNGRHGYGPLNSMVVNWWNTMSSSDIATPLLVGTLLRACIYKRRSTHLTSAEGRA